MFVGDVMTSPALTVDRNCSIAFAARFMATESVGSLAVVEGDKLFGIITDRDVVVRCTASGHDPAACKVWDHASYPVMLVEPSVSTVDAAGRMAAHGFKRLAVVKGERLIGVITLSDIAEDMKVSIGNRLKVEGADVDRRRRSKAGSAPEVPAA